MQSKFYSHRSTNQGPSSFLARVGLARRRLQKRYLCTELRRWRQDVTRNISARCLDRFLLFGGVVWRYFANLQRISGPPISKQPHCCWLARIDAWRSWDGEDQHWRSGSQIQSYPGSFWQRPGLRIGSLAPKKRHPNSQPFVQHIQRLAFALFWGQDHPKR